MVNSIQTVVHQVEPKRSVEAVNLFISE